MPIYEYHCQACDAHTELLQKISATPATECPHCKAHALKRMISPSGFRLKGTGWYVTDTRDKGKPKKPEAKTEASAEKPTDSKTDKNKTEE
ncbi:MAG: zinc ribbon domain-containing protein [Gammaproteobacteria bacterium]|nr:zinc ribbon domain-containing protein [Gammaproteobacteria bacterium]